MLIYARDFLPSTTHIRWEQLSLRWDGTIAQEHTDVHQHTEQPESIPRDGTPRLLNILFIDDVFSIVGPFIVVH